MTAGKGVSGGMGGEGEGVYRRVTGRRNDGDYDVAYHVLFVVEKPVHCDDSLV